MFGLMVGFFYFNSTMGKKKKKKKKPREGESNLLSHSFYETKCFTYFHPHCLLFTLSTWHDRRGRFI